MDFKNVVIGAVAGAAALLSVSAANAALVSVVSPTFDISANFGSQGYGLNLTGMTGDTFEADMVFKVVDADANSVGATTVENLFVTGPTANLEFTSIELYREDGAVDTLLATGTITVADVPFAVASLGEMISLQEGVTYYIRTSGEFVAGGNASIGGTVSLTPVPVPAALPLIVSALAAVGLVGVRRKS
jgi:hypothetical protein